MEGPVTATQEIYHFRRQGIAPDGTVMGAYESTGIRPQFAERLQVAGVDLPGSMFSDGYGR
jgi:pilus assembly protein CpaF